MKAAIPFGAFVVMHGVNMQKYYEHTVDSDVLLRFVATLRHVSDEHEEHQKRKIAKQEAREAEKQAPKEGRKRKIRKSKAEIDTEEQDEPAGKKRQGVSQKARR
jgi:hypothetical protein